MTAALRQVLFLVACLGLGIGTLSPLGGAHCQGPKSSQAPSHHAGHHKDTEPARECPHCPPAECQRHSQCVVTLDTGAVNQAPTQPAPIAGTRYQATAPALVDVPAQPPTPPPQLLG